ncbi:box C/D snoRNA protein 1-like [Polypterus senegalus]
MARKYSVHLKLLPIGFSKRKENSTMFHKKDQMIFWHLKLIFVQSQCEFVEKRVSSSRTLNDILGQYIHPTESDPVFRQRLKIYALSPCDEVEVFMKVENRRSDAVRYYKLDPTKSLIENLKNKTIIEYPTLHIVLKDQASKYLILGQEIAECCETSQNAVHFKEEDELEEGELRDDDC